VTARRTPAGIVLQQHHLGASGRGGASGLQPELLRLPAATFLAVTESGSAHVAVGPALGEEGLRAAAGGVAGQPLQDQRPGLGGVREVDLWVPVGEAVVPE